MCLNATLCKEKLALVLPSTPPYGPRQFERCAVVGNSGDLLQDLFGAQIDGYDAVIRMNGAPIKVGIISNTRLHFCTSADFYMTLIYRDCFTMYLQY